MQWNSVSSWVLLSRVGPHDDDPERWTLQATNRQDAMGVKRQETVGSAIE